MPRVHAELRLELAVGRKRVARLMRPYGLVGITRRRRRGITRRDAERDRPCVNLGTPRACGAYEDRDHEPTGNPHLIWGTEADHPVAVSLRVGVRRLGVRGFLVAGTLDGAGAVAGPVDRECRAHGPVGQYHSAASTHLPVTGSQFRPADQVGG